MVLFRIMVAVVVAASLGACGGKSKRSTGGGGEGGGGGEEKDAGPTEPAPVTKLTHIGLEYIVVDPDAEPLSSRVSVIFTDETGAARREVIGEFPGGCSDVSQAARSEAMKPILGLDCWEGDRGVQLRFVNRQSKLYVVSAQVESGGEASYQPLTTIELRVGAVIQTDYDK